MKNTSIVLRLCVYSQTDDVCLSAKHMDIIDIESYAKTKPNANLNNNQGLDFPRKIILFFPITTCGVVRLLHVSRSNG